MKAADAFNPLHYDMIMIGVGRGTRAAMRYDAVSIATYPDTITGCQTIDMYMYLHRCIYLCR